MILVHNPVIEDEVEEDVSVEGESVVERDPADAADAEETDADADVPDVEEEVPDLSDESDDNSNDPADSSHNSGDETPSLRRSVRFKSKPLILTYNKPGGNPSYTQR